MHKLLPTIVATLTGVPRSIVRQGIDFEWGNLLTYNAFRLYEMIFWRRDGIRPSMTTRVVSIRADDRSLPCEFCKSIRKILYGESEQAQAMARYTYEFHSWEAIIVHSEVILRNIFTTNWLPKLATFRLYLPQTTMATSGVTSPYLFAIGFDAAVTYSDSANPFTVTHTATGSNLSVMAGVRDCSTAGPATVTWNGSGMTSQGVGAVSCPCSLWGISSAASGTHDVVITYTIGNGSVVQGEVVSYSGTGVLQNGTSNTTAAGSTLAVTVTVGGTNSWVVGAASNTGAGNLSAGSNTSSRSSANSATFFGESSGNPVSSNTTINADNSATAVIQWGACEITTAATPAGGRAEPYFATLGVGT